MLKPITFANEQYLATSRRLQGTSAEMQSRLGSGLRVTLPSDDATATPLIEDLLTRMAADEQLQRNLSENRTELATAESMLQQAVRLVDVAVQAGLQGSSPAEPPLAPLIQQVEGVLQQMAALSTKNANGRYIFSGEAELAPAYSYDPATGVTRLVPTATNRVVYGANGTPIYETLTAQEIFDQRDAADVPTANNVFAGLTTMLTALKAGDRKAAADAAVQLKTPGEYLNVQLSRYGLSSVRLDAEMEAISDRTLASQERLSELRDADPTATIQELLQAQTSLEASISAQTQTQRLNLFDFLG